MRSEPSRKTPLLVSACLLGLECRYDGKVLEKGEKRSEAFLRGAHGALALGRLFECRAAVLKERSPSCGVEALSRAGRVSPGRGVTAALLAQEGFELLSDEDPRLEERLREHDEANR